MLGRLAYFWRHWTMLFTFISFNLELYALYFDHHFKYGDGLSTGRVKSHYFYKHVLSHGFQKNNVVLPAETTTSMNNVNSEGKPTFLSRPPSRWREGRSRRGSSPRSWCPGPGGCASSSSTQHRNMMESYFITPLRVQDTKVVNTTSVADPYVFGSPGSGSFYHQVKIVKKTLIPTILWT